MNSGFSISEFYKELEAQLRTSTVEIRKSWAAIIVENDVELKTLSGLLACEQKIATRFLWLLTEVGQLHSNKLFGELPNLFELCGSLNPEYRQAFATFWLVAGVPPENEGKATDLLFQLLLSNDASVTIKLRALSVLSKLTEKYPDLKNELRLCLEEQMDRHSAEFKKRATKILIGLV